MRAKLFILLAALAGPATAQAPAPASKPAGPAATVDGTPVTEAEIVFAESALSSELAGFPAESRRRVLVEYLVEAKLIAAAAAAEGLDKGTGFEQRLNYHRTQALREAYIEKHQSQVTDAQARAVYDAQIGKAEAQEEIRARHILVESEADAKSVAAELSGGADFAEVAKKRSQDPGAQNGGDLGYFTRGQMVKTFEDAAFSLEPGKVSVPVQSEFGWHVIRVEDKRKQQPPAYDDIKSQIMAQLIQSNLQGAVRDLRAKAKIDILDPAVKKAIEQDEAATTSGGEAPSPGASPAAPPAN